MGKPLIDCDIIFLGGVHAVGKTSFSQNLENYFKFEAYSASKLVKHTSSAKEVSSVKDNQNVLIDALRKQITTVETILLDGHFCLQTKKGNIENVPLSTFQCISPKAIILLILDPIIISERFFERDGVYKSPDFIKIFQEQEIDRASIVSETLSIPLSIVDTLTSPEAIYNKVRRYFVD